MKKLLLAAGGIAVIAWAAPALTQAAAPVAASAKQPMTRAQAAQKAQQRFARLDINKDGFITEADRQARAGQRAQRAQQRPIRRNPDAMFTRRDTNRDAKSPAQKSRPCMLLE
jgi:hypothetical protein